MADVPSNLSKEALKAQQESVAAAQRHLDIEKENLRLAKERGEETKNYAQYVAEAAAELRDQEDVLKEIVEGRKEINASLKEEVTDLNKIAERYGKIKGNLDAQLAAVEAQKESIAKQKELLIERLKTEEDIKDEVEEILEDLEKQTEELEKQEEILKKQKGAYKSVSKTIRGLLGFSEQAEASFAEQLGIAVKQKGVWGTIKGIWKDMGGLGGVINNIGEKATEGLVALFKIGMDLAFAMDNATTGFLQATGAADKYAATIEESWQQSKHLAVTADEVSAANKALYTTFTDFTFATDQQRLALSNTANELLRLGVTNEQFAKSLQTGTKAFGMSRDEAEGFSRDLTQYARVIGVEAGAMQDQFSQIGPELAKMGDQGTTAFKELARISKITGLEMSKVIAITDQFDTFEGAAKTVGSLNALLGGDFVNSMDLMMATNPADRFMMIKDALDAAGKSFDTMGYYEKLAVKESLGLKDVGELAMVMAGNFDLLDESLVKTTADYEEQARIAKANLSLQQDFKAVLAEMAPDLMVVMEMMKGFVKWLGESEQLMKSVIPALLTYKAVTLGLAVAQFFQAASGTLSTKSLWKFAGISLLIAGIFFGTKYVIGSTGNFIEGMWALGFAFLAIGAASKIGGKGMKKMIGPVLAIGAAMTAVLLGIKEAVVGFAQLADSMAKLSDTQLEAFTGVLIGFGVGMAIMMGILAALVFTGVGPAAVGLLLAFGAAVLMIGAGVGLAATGIGLMAEGFATLFAAIDLTKVLALGVFFLTVGTMAPLLGLAAISMGLVATAVGGLGLAMIMLNEDKLAPLAQFVTGLGMLAQSASGLSVVAKEIRNIVDAIDDLPESAAVSVSHMVTTTAAASIATKKAGISASPSHGTAGRSSGKVPLNVTLNVKFDYDDLQAILKNDFVTKKELTDAILSDGGG